MSSGRQKPNWDIPNSRHDEWPVAPPRHRNPRDRSARCGCMARARARACARAASICAHARREAAARHDSQRHGPACRGEAPSRPPTRTRWMAAEAATGSTATGSTESATATDNERRGRRCPPPATTALAIAIDNGRPRWRRRRRWRRRQWRTTTEATVAADIATQAGDDTGRPRRNDDDDDDGAPERGFGGLSPVAGSASVCVDVLGASAWSSQQSGFVLDPCGLRLLVVVVVCVSHRCAHLSHARMVIVDLQSRLGAPPDCPCCSRSFRSPSWTRCRVLVRRRQNRPTVKICTGLGSLKQRISFTVRGLSKHDTTFRVVPRLVSLFRLGSRHAPPEQPTLSAVLVKGAVIVNNVLRRWQSTMLMTTRSFGSLSSSVLSSCAVAAFRSF